MRHAPLLSPDPELVEAVYIIITNNPMVHERFSDLEGLRFEADFSFVDVLAFARDQVHLGRPLLSHPLAGSVQPGQTPYKTIVLSKKLEGVDVESVLMIEDCLLVSKRMTRSLNRPLMNVKTDADFQLIDYDLVEDSIKQYISLA